MGQTFHTTCDQMNSWRWDNHSDFGDQVDHCNLQTTSFGKVTCTAKSFSWYNGDDLRVKIEPPSCQQYKLGDILAIRLVSWDDTIDENDDNENWVDPGAPRGGMSCLGNGNDNYDGKSEKDTQGGDKGTGKRNGTIDGKGTWKATQDMKVTGKVMEKGKRNGKGKGKRKGKGKGKEKGIVKQTSRGESLQSSGKDKGSRGHGTRRAN